MQTCNSEIECKVEMIDNFNKLLNDVLKSYHNNDYDSKIIDSLVISIKSFYDNNKTTEETSEESSLSSLFDDDDESQGKVTEPIPKPIVEKPKIDKVALSFLNNSMNVDSYYYLNSINNMRINNYCSQITNY